MAYKKWIHNCKFHDNAEVELSVKVCPECGEEGIFDGWGLSVIEMMGSYQRRYNLRPIGPHRKMTDELFHGRMKKCEFCHGFGLIGSSEDDHHEICPECNFGQYVFDGTPEEFESIRQKIFAAYPYADLSVEMPKRTENSESTEEFVGGGFFKPGDNSLQSFKDFVTELTKAMAPGSMEDLLSWTDEQWEEKFKKASSKSKTED
jgi:hypothetical protein